MLLPKLLTVGFLLGAAVCASVGVILVIRSTRRASKIMNTTHGTGADAEIDIEKFERLLDQFNQLRRSNNIDDSSNLNEEESSLPEEPSNIKPKLTVVK